MTEQPEQNTLTVQTAQQWALQVNDTRNQTVAIQKLLEQVMVKDTHYGVIPGTSGKPSLYKAGAEKIAMTFHLAPSFQREERWDGEHLTVHSECTLRHQATGVVVASAGGMCSTRETKYAWRQAVRVCPECGKPAIIKGKAQYGGGWLCYKNKGGCGEKWPDESEQAHAFEAISGEREPNPNIADTYNTVLKMADKRAFVAATLFGTAASDCFTQDIEDFVDVGGGPPPPQPTISTAWTLAAVKAEMDAYADLEEFKAWWEANKRQISKDLTKGEYALALDHGIATKERCDALGAGPKPEPPAPAGMSEQEFDNLIRTLRDAKDRKGLDEFASQVAVAGMSEQQRLRYTDTLDVLRAKFDEGA